MSGKNIPTDPLQPVSRNNRSSRPLKNQVTGSSSLPNRDRKGVGAFFSSLPGQTTQEAAMSTNEVHSNDPTGARVNMKLEVFVIPVSDVDRAKQFYAKLGWRFDADFAAGADYRVIQFTPPGSGCSVIFGKNVPPAAPGSAQGLYLIVSDIQTARKALLDRGVQISEAFHNGGVYAGTDEAYLSGRVRASGPDPEHRSYSSFASFKDPDGNGWLFQEITTRLP